MSTGGSEGLEAEGSGDPTPVPEPSIERTAESNPPASPGDEPLGRGATIGRYVLLDEIGSGAMGVVYAAYDPELDRRLALKLLHSYTGGRRAESLRNRLRREAQALARLHHQNVVAVHDVGTHEDRVFVAMEFVAGETLRAWLRTQAPRKIDEIVEVFAAAGRGLAAAHRAGLIHRDFKPENVLLDREGGVRVVDFGLARRSREESMISEDGEPTPVTREHDPSDGFAPSRRSLDLSLTNTGGMMGTPAYMAPEQLRGRRATARSDQFSFCVALWEALYGLRPFPGEDLHSLTQAVIEGRVREPPSEGKFANRGVPAHVHRAVMRGLSVEPEDRFPTLDKLITALTHDPARRRRRLLTIVAANLLGAGLIFTAGVWVAEQFEDEQEILVCEPEERLAGIWDAPRRTRVAERFESIDAPFAAHANLEVHRRLDSYAQEWVAAWRRSCELERSQGPSPEFDQRRECLEQRRRELATFTDALLTSDPERFLAQAELAVSAVEALSPIHTCANPERFAGRVSDAEQSERITELEAGLTEAMTLGRLGEVGAGLERAREVVAEARELDNPRMQVRALGTLAELESKIQDNDPAVEHLREAYAIAERGGEDWLRAEIATKLVSMFGFRLDRRAESGVWAEVADALLERVGDPDDLRGRWWFSVGVVHMRASELDEAELALDKALELLERAFGSDSREVDGVLQSLGSLARERGNHARAVDYHERMLERRLASYGPEHPDVAAAHGTLGNDAYVRGDYEQAQVHFEQALEIIAAAYGEDSPAYARRLNNYAAVLERLGRLDEAEAIHRKLLAAKLESYGEDDVRVTSSLENLGLVLVSAGRFPEAVEQFERSLAIRREHHGPRHVSTATSQLNLGYALARLGEHERARALYEVALATWHDKLGADHPDLALVHDNLGELDLEAGALDEARQHFERSLSLTEAALGEDAADLGYSLTGLARVALAEGDAADAIQLSERALEVREGSWLPPGDLGLTQLTLSRALALRGRGDDRKRAKDLATLALKDISAGKDESRVAEAKAWLAELE